MSELVLNVVEFQNKYKWVVCTRCGGTGWKRAFWGKCPRCEGEGYLEVRWTENAHE